MGLGKTLQIISLCVGMHYAKKSEPILIIVPCTLQRQVGLKSLLWKCQNSVRATFRNKLSKSKKVGSRIRIVVALIKCSNTRNGKRLSPNKERIISVNYSVFADLNMTLDDLWGIIPFILPGMNVFELMPKVSLLLNTSFLLGLSHNFIFAGHEKEKTLILSSYQYQLGSCRLWWRSSIKKYELSNNQNDKANQLWLSFYFDR